MARQQGWFALILALAIAAAAVLSSFPLQLGLDLRGGSQLTLEVQPAGEITTIGTESRWALATPVIRLVAPGPDVAIHTPTRPLARA